MGERCGGRGRDVEDGREMGRTGRTGRAMWRTGRVMEIYNVIIIFALHYTFYVDLLS